MQMFTEISKFDKTDNQQQVSLKAIMRFLEANKIKSASEHLLIMQDWHKFLRDTLRAKSSEAVTFDEFCRIMQAKGATFTSGGKINSIVKSKMLFAVAQVFDQLIKMDFIVGNNKARINNQALTGPFLSDDVIARLFGPRAMSSECVDAQSLIEFVRTFGQARLS